MVQFQVLTGALAGTNIVARHFPFRLGRQARAELRLEAAGVWDQHAELSCDPTRGFVLRSRPEALTTVNGAALQDQAVTLRNGDVIEVGAVRLQFWLSPARQRGLAVREALVWIALAGLVGIQVGLVYWLR